MKSVLLGTFSDSTRSSFLQTPEW